MARPIRSIEIYLPLDYNDGRPIAPSKYISLQEELLSRFGGVTSVQRQFPLQGVWQSDRHVYHDRVVVFTVMDFSDSTQIECLQYLQRLKTRLKKKLDQLDVLITVADMLAV
ncbi:MAG: hypothetical protein ACREHD_01220 [Pirellulales bacterium]